MFFSQKKKILTSARTYSRVQQPEIPPQYQQQYISGYNAHSSQGYQYPSVSSLNGGNGVFECVSANGNSSMSSLFFASNQKRKIEEAAPQKAVPPTKRTKIIEVGLSDEDPGIDSEEDTKSGREVISSQ